jgi:hypothetical protein
MFARIVSMQLKANTHREFTEKFERDIIPTLECPSCKCPSWLSAIPPRLPGMIGEPSGARRMVTRCCSAKL